MIVAPPKGGATKMRKSMTKLKSYIKHQIKLESQNRPLGKYPFALRLAEEMGLEISASKGQKKSFVQLKKKKDLLMTLISGPHVHKKTRDQYHIFSYSALFTIFTTTQEEQDLFLEYKTKLRESSFFLRQNEGIQYTFSSCQVVPLDLIMYHCSSPKGTSKIFCPFGAKRSSSHPVARRPLRGRRQRLSFQRAAPKGRPNDNSQKSFFSAKQKPRPLEGRRAIFK